MEHPPASPAPHSVPDLLCRAWRVVIPGHRQMLQHLYGDPRDHRTLYTAAVVVARCQDAGPVVRWPIPYRGPAWAHVLALAWKTPKGGDHDGG